MLRNNHGFLFGLAAAISVSAAPAPADDTIRTAMPFSDQFSADGSIASGWVVNTPNTASFASIVPRKGLLLDASWKNGGSDLWPGTAYQGSTMLQPLPALKAWIAEVKLTYNNAYVSSTNLHSFMAAGMLLSTQSSGFTASSKFIRYELGNGDSGGSTADIETAFNGTGGAAAVYGQKTVYLKIKKAGKTYTFSYSSDGVNWSTLTTYADTTAYSFIGLVSLRNPYDGAQIDSGPVFTYFNIKVLS